MSDRILLLNGGTIEQQGTPQQMYSTPETLFTADFMGSNNRLPGRVAEVRDGAALLEGDGWRLWGTAQGRRRERQRRRRHDPPRAHPHRRRAPATTGSPRDLTTSMYLGDKWEHLFALGGERLRAYGDRPLAAGQHWLELPRQDFWVF